MRSILVRCLDSHCVTQGQFPFCFQNVKSCKDEITGLSFLELHERLVDGTTSASLVLKVHQLQASHTTLFTRTMTNIKCEERILSSRHYLVNVFCSHCGVCVCACADLRTERERGDMVPKKGTLPNWSLAVFHRDRVLLLISRYVVCRLWK